MADETEIVVSIFRSEQAQCEAYDRVVEHVFTPELLRQLGDLAKRQNISIVELYLRAMTDYLNRYRAKGEPGYWLGRARELETERLQRRGPEDADCC